MPLRLHVYTAADDAAQVLASARVMVEGAFEGDFSDDDWAHALGGHHVVLLDGDAVVAHAALAEREIRSGGRPWRAGYVEAVATAPGRQGQGAGSTVMEEVNRLLRRHYELGLLSTGRPSFYARLGWEAWLGPSSVRREGRLVPTPDDDGGLMVLRFGPSANLDVTSPISCEDRPGDPW